MLRRDTPGSGVIPFAIRCWWTVLLIITAVPQTANAESRIGGHFGCVIPLVTHAQGDTVTVSDDVVIGFPTGVTLKTSNRVAFDLELVPVIQNAPLGVSLTVHPGVIVSGPHRLAGGIRMAFDVNGASWGFTPLLNRSFAVSKSSAVFAELVVPIRFQQDVRHENFTSIGLGVHFGVGF